MASADHVGATASYVVHLTQTFLESCLAWATSWRNLETTVLFASSVAKRNISFALEKGAMKD
jgi:hypothetical protein